MSRPYADPLSIPSPETDAGGDDPLAWFSLSLEVRRLPGRLGELARLGLAATDGTPGEASGEDPGRWM